jgi:hypothetical protein
MSRSTLTKRRISADHVSKPVESVKVTASGRYKIIRWLAGAWRSITGNMTGILKGRKGAVARKRGT